MTRTDGRVEDVNDHGVLPRVEIRIAALQLEITRVGRTWTRELKEKDDASSIEWLRV